MVDMRMPPEPKPRTPPTATTGRSLQRLRRAKFYVLINAFICSVALASHQLVALASRQPGATVAATITAMYASALVRIAAVLCWFEWIATRKHRILGDKRVALTAPQRRAIYARILWLVAPTECLSFWIVQPSSAASSAVESTASGRWQASDACAFFLLEFAAFIPKSLLFEVIFDLFHYAAHWLCHQSAWLYQHVHKRHHLHLHPCPLSTYEQDAVDLCLTNVLPFFLAVTLGLPLSTLQLHLMFAYKTYVEVAGHSGLELKGFSFPQLPLVNELSVCLRVHDHDLHHTHPKFNFAKRFALWDKLFGTFRPGRPLLETAKL
ncbi:hypothetical protein PybrP1_009806 [[Pythium] brassicae (nom. inval.)]|nr:hypothetical protein PybrP1_009806 [[Pythium] brassicae (nom. inval.)]